METSNFTGQTNISGKIVYIAGMSGIGKTKLSVEVGKYIKRAEVINMDSLQLYKVHETLDTDS